MELLLSISEGRNNVSPAEENMAQMLARLQFDGNMDSGREFVKQVIFFCLFTVGRIKLSADEWAQIPSILCSVRMDYIIICPTKSHLS
jgi:proline racemase